SRKKVRALARKNPGEKGKGVRHRWDGTFPFPMQFTQHTLPAARGKPMIRVRGMTFEDLPLGLRLKQRAGWNQTAADWARFLSLQSDGCFVAELDATAVGTVTTCILGRVAWVGMMLVEANLRGQGIGRALLTRALEFLESKGVRSVRL